MAIGYDRRPSPLLSHALGMLGFAQSLVEYARGGRLGLDLQFRGYANKDPHWATLYVGLTKVLDLHASTKRGYKLKAHASWAAPEHGFDPDWSQWRDEDWFRERWRDVEGYLEQVIPKVGHRFLVEGSVQSAISAFDSRQMVVIDREATVTFHDQFEKDAVCNRLQQPLLDAVQRAGAPAWWKPPTSLGGECDALAIGQHGELLAIEVKPARASSTIPWSVLQVRQYTYLFQEWANQEPEASEVIMGMLQTRKDLGLVRDVPARLEQPLRVRPLIAIRWGVSAEVMRRFAEVQRWMAAAGLDDPPVQVALVNIAGRLDPVQL
jgi:hypothetical protein